MRPARPKNLATKTVAWPCASVVSIHWRQGLRIQVSLQPFRRTRQPLQLMLFLDGSNNRRNVKYGKRERECNGIEFEEMERGIYKEEMGRVGLKFWSS